MPEDTPQEPEEPEEPEEPQLTPMQQAAKMGAQSIANGIWNRDPKAGAQLVGFVYFLLNVATIFGARIELIDNPDNTDGDLQKLIALVDSRTGQKIDSDVILHRLDYIIEIVRKNNLMPSPSPGDNELGDEDL